MKILVMGTGAVGGCFGGMLKYAGYDVVFYARGENFRAIQSSGLHVESVAAGKFSITPPVVKNIENIDCTEFYDDFKMEPLKSLHCSKHTRET